MSASDPPPRACQECNRKKTRCDMKRPVCGLCRRTGNDCHFPLRRKRSGAENSALHGQTRVLQERMTRLVELLESNPPVVEQVKRRGCVNAARTPQSILSDSRNQTPLSSLNNADAFQYAAEVSSTNPRTIETNETPRTPEHIEVSYSEAMFLIDIFFERVQPWLPMLHKPRFQRHYSKLLSQRLNCLDGLAIDEKLLLCCMFTLGASVAPSGSSSKYPIVDQKELLAQLSCQVYAKVRSIITPTVKCLQGCVLLAFIFYTSGLSAQGWILVGLCGRIAYELALFEIDDPDNPETASRDWVEVEEMRRLWWCVWELDTFGSSLSKKPFAVNHQQFMVKLPISDHLWFNEQPCSSSILLTRPGQSWKSLQDCENKCERAWLLIANHIMATACEYHSMNRGVPAEEKSVLENEISCLKLSLPPQFNIVTVALCSTSTNFAENNSILATHIFLTVATYMVTTILVDDQIGTSSPLPGMISLESATIARALATSRIISQWAPECIDTAHPFLVCCLTRPFSPRTPPGRHSQLLHSTDDMTTLMLQKFAERWRLASSMIVIRRMLSKRSPLTVDESALARRYAVYFPSFIRPDLTHISPEPHPNGPLPQPLATRSNSIPDLYAPADFYFPGLDLLEMDVFRTDFEYGSAMA